MEKIIKILKENPLVRHISKCLAIATCIVCGIALIVIFGLAATSSTWWFVGVLPICLPAAVAAGVAFWIEEEF